MKTLNQIKKKNVIDRSEFENISDVMFQSFLLTKDYKSQSFLRKKEELLYSFSQFLEKYVELHFLNSNNRKLEFIDFIDKLNLQKEIIELEKEKISLSDISKAGKSLGRKAQSGFIQK